MRRHEHAARGLDAGPRRRGPLGTEQHQGGVERQGLERLGGEPDRLAAVDTGDDGDAGGEVAHHLFEAGDLEGLP